MFSRIRAAALLALLGSAPAIGAPAPGSAAPFVVTASSGPQAGSRIVATVTRAIGKTNVTLPAALVPALRPGDIVDVDFPDYRRPPSSVNYHINVAFITETAPQRWFFERSVPADRLFSNPRPGKHPPAAPAGHLHFVYGSKYYRGIPIFTIIPEDAKTRGVDGVRDYVNAHPSDFVAMSQSTNDAVDKYSFLSDFLGSLANGSIDPTASQARVESVAQGLGVPSASIEACYVAGTPQTEVNYCVQQAIQGTVYQTNFAAPTRAQFLGGVAGAAEPLSVAPYLSALLTVWNVFVHTGHLEYEYLPATITLADPSTVRHDELLMGVKVPTIRPPAAASDVLFFTIGDPQATEHAPAVVNGAPANGICERTDRFSIPMHFDHTSRYVHDAALVVTPDGHASYRLPLDPRSLDAPVIAGRQMSGSSDDAYTLSLTGQFGFDPVSQPALAKLRVAFPGNAPWSIEPALHRPLVAGEALDVIATSADAPCLSHVELVVGSAPPVAVTMTQLDDRRVELRASLAGLPAGPAHLRLDQDDPRDRRQIETVAALTLAAPPAQVDAKTAVAAIGDQFLHLAGAGFERIRSVLVNGAAYIKEAGATSTSACFDGPPLGSSAVSGQSISAQLQPADGSAGEVFPVTLSAPRPALAQAILPPSEPAEHLSTKAVAVTLDGGTQPLPRAFAVRVRQAPAAVTPCAALDTDPTAITLPETAIQPRSPSTAVVSFLPSVLRARAFGTLEVQVVDTASGLGSAWAALTGKFVRAPLVTQIACPADANAACRLYGSDLSAIGAIEEPPQAFVAPDTSCPPTDKGVTCVYVPHLAHYALRLVDDGVVESLPDALITR